MNRAILATIAFGSSTLLACASTPGAKPSDMSEAQHEQAAGVHEAQATEHGAQYSAGAQTTATACDSRDPSSGFCWTSTSNPTKQHLDDAEKHRKMAADHRAASQALRDAETWACVGISPNDRDMSPFNHREDITSVQPAYVHISGKQPRDQLVGATVTFRAVPGMTAEWLQREVDCHIGRNNALGNDVPEMPYCPLVPKGITGTVSSTGNGFAVRIESQDSNTAKEVLRRAQGLGNPG
jgi:hypothetical protein